MIDAQIAFIDTTESAVHIHLCLGTRCAQGVMVVIAWSAMLCSPTVGRRCPPTVCRATRSTPWLPMTFINNQRVRCSPIIVGHVLFARRLVADQVQGGLPTVGRALTACCDAVGRWECGRAWSSLGEAQACGRSRPRIGNMSTSLCVLIPLVMASASARPDQDYA